jgi:lycopene cyclase domain-containing protein
MHYLYLLINLLSIIVPFIKSFDPRVDFYKKWKYLFPAIATVGSFFVIWDIIFTHWGIWGFNDRYLSGIHIVNLPLGEWLFFVIIPYCCIFVYEVMNYYVPQDILGKYARRITVFLIIGLGIVGVFTAWRWYTSLTFLLTVAFLLYHLLVLKVDYLGRFYLAMCVWLIPFFIVNGILTGSFIEEQVVWYNNAENLSIRMFTIPVEDTFYGMLLILMNTTIYEHLKRKDEDR